MKIVILRRNLHLLRSKDKYALRVAEAYAAKGCHVTILTSGPINQLTSSNCGVVCITPSSAIRCASLLHYDQQCRQWIKNSTPDVVLGMDFNSSQTHYFACNGVYAAYLQKKNLVDTFWKQFADWISPFNRLILDLERRALKSVDLRLILTPSFMVRDEFIVHYDIDVSKICVLPAGINLNESQHAFDKWHINQGWLKLTRNLSSSAFQLLFVGNDYSKKGLKYLMEGLSLLPSADIQLSVVGSDHKMHRFVELAEKLKIKDKVKFFGYCENVNEFYQIADVIVNPSIYDPFSNITLEALAMGAFVISSRYNGAKELLLPQTGALIDNLFDPDSVAESLKTAMAHQKTVESAKQIRNSIKHLDLASQLDELIEQTIDYQEVEKIAKLLW